MKKIKTAFALPLFWLLFKVSKDMHKIQVDGQAWCQWQHKNFTLWNMCSLFIGFKEFRNLLPHRISPPSDRVDFSPHDKFIYYHSSLRCG